MLQFRSFSKSFGGRQVIGIDDADFSAGIYHLKGANGAGKSTLLKCISGFLSYQGDISVNNVSLKKAGIAYRKMVNFGDAEPLFPDFLTGSELIRLFADAKGDSAIPIADYLEAFGMNSYINHPVSTYSSGMVKKLSLVCAFIGKPMLICLDEPLITLDAASVDALYHLIRLNHTGQNTSFILSSHQDIDSSIQSEGKSLVLKDGILGLE